MDPRHPNVAFAANTCALVLGIGLLFLIARNLLDQARDGNPVVFAATILLLLYGAAIVGIAYRWGYSVWRGEKVKDEFEEQIEELERLVSNLRVEVAKKKDK